MTETSKFFDKDISILMAFRITRPAIEVFTGSFLIAYLLKIAQDNLCPIALYYIFFAITVSIMFFALGNFVKRKNKMILFRAGVVGNFLQLLAIILLKEQVINHIVTFGITYGLYVGFYASAYNNLLSEKIPAHKTGKAFGYLNALGNTTKIAASYILGKYISISSFEESVVIIMALSCLEIMLSFFIKSEGVRGHKFIPIAFWKRVRDDRIFHKVFFIEFLKGFTLYGCISVLIMVYTIHKFGNDLKLGIFNSLFAILTIAISFVFGRFIKKEQYSTLSIINSLFIFVAVALFSLQDNHANFILYNVCYATFVQLILLISDVNLFNISNGSKVQNAYRIEYFAIREIFLNSGRVSGYLLLFFAGTFASPHSLKALLIFLTLCVSLVGLLSNRLQKELEEGLVEAQGAVAEAA